VYIIVDWDHTVFYGPFSTREDAQEWLNNQDVAVAMLGDVEVSILSLEAPSKKLGMV
jgi:hypothetical protein